MNKLKILIKTSLLQTLGSFKYGKKQSKVLGSTLFIIAIGIILVAIMSFNAVMQINVYQEQGMAHIVLLSSLLLALLLSILMSITRGGVSNTTNDAEFLLSSPLSRRTILLGKSVSKYLFELAPITVFLLPSVIVYYIMIEPGLGFLFRGILIFLLLMVGYVD